jgi:hypothetical protein
MAAPAILKKSRRDRQISSLIPHPSSFYHLQYVFDAKEESPSYSSNDSGGENPEWGE